MESNKLPTIITMLFVLLAVLALSGCTSPTPTATPTPAPAATATPVPSATPAPGTVALTINGSVTTPQSLTLDALRAMPQQTVNGSYVKNNATNYVAGSGPSLNALLNQSGPVTTAMNITFVGADGYAKTIALSAVTGDANATVIIGSDGSLRDVIPSQASGSWVSNLAIITVS